MAEEQAIPEAVMSEAKALCTAVNFEGVHAAETVARALLAAELRGREQQKQADARIAETIFPNGKLKSQQVAHVCGNRIAHAIRL